MDNDWGWVYTGDDDCMTKQVVIEQTYKREQQERWTLRWKTRLMTSVKETPFELFRK